ncbi:L-2,4-diaminobutyrate decarboxylase [Hartmannibacter diazotrophicus]|uniref:L-2,4-diaminobutyrate decarboxylase n=1 Tax=Hartmannibacter diazotrophicus TaxID=1482074 RepID=A0A2C9D203_9HYPH|nr:pyridoxal-dependent decarboxylase [Hartmannibacter diazotrophicus]SON54178.1 L-2,4-diaminobutyrate decarboxylase [Hartmannibacter diazotrophicus]
MTTNDTRHLLAEAAQRAADYLEALPDRHVGPLPGAVEKLVSALDMPLPDQGSGDADVLGFIDGYGSPSTVASAGGRYFGFVTGGTLPAALAANYLASAWDQNSFGWTSSPAVAAFEVAALRWVKEALGLPMAAEGALVTGATMAHFTCLTAARNRVLRQAGWDVDADGLFGAPAITVIVGEEAHASLLKVLSMLGLGRSRVVRLPCNDQGRILPRDLPQIKGPTIVCLQAGNVNSGGFDPAELLIEWAHAGGAWVHADGAFGIWALASPALAGLAKGYTAADSWALDGHKWLNVPYDSGIALVADASALSDAMSISGAYLMSGGRREAMNLTPESSRRARAVDIWAALKSLGRQGLAELVERNCRQARDLADGLRAAGVEVLNDVVLNQVVVSFGSEARTKEVIEAVQAGGECWCGATVWKGRAAMRVSVSSWATTDEDIARSVAAIVKAVRETPEQ